MIQTTSIAFLCLALFGSGRTRDFDPEASVVKIEVNLKRYDYNMPWSVRDQQVHKNGIVIGKRRILTNADGLAHTHFCRIRKANDNEPYPAELKWVDHYANVAVFEVPSPDFWKSMRAVTFARKIPQDEELQGYGWRSDRIEEYKAEIVRIYGSSGKKSYLQHLNIDASSNLKAGGGSEPVLDGNQLVGLTVAAQNNNRLTVLPATFIALVIRNHESGNDPGLGYFDFNYMPAKNPALPTSKGFKRRNVSVLVTEVGHKRLGENTLKTGDIILAIDGFEIDNGGHYIDPQYGRLSMKSLATRRHRANETIRIRLWRDNEERTVDYLLPRADFKKSFIPEHLYDTPPQYLIAGGFVFQPLNGPLIQALGNPALLKYYNSRPPIEGRDGLVLVTQVLPDDYNEGYENLYATIIDRINGRKIHRLEDVEKALKIPEDGLHRIQFMPDGDIRHVVLNAEKMPSATARILKKYYISAERSE